MNDTYINAVVHGTGNPGLMECLRGIERDFTGEGYGLELLFERSRAFEKAHMTAEEHMEALIRSAAELTSREAPRWEFAAARLRYCQFEQEVKERLGTLGIVSLYDKLKYLTDQGLYGAYILENYSREEIAQAQGFIREERNCLFTYAGLDLLLKRYVIQDRERHGLETPQEMYLGIALHLAMKEKKNVRMEWVRRFYDMLSQIKVTMATPTLSNARKPYHQLSSCFIDTVPDSLEGIYRSVDNFAQVSKFGGGMGLYFGKVRATGSSIRGFK